MSNADVTSTSTVESSDESRTNSDDYTAPRVPEDSFNTSVKYNFDIFNSTVSQLAGELIQGRTSPIASISSQMKAYFESDLYLNTVVSSLNNTINQHLLGLEIPAYNPSVPGASEEDPYRLKLSSIIKIKY